MRKSQGNSNCCSSNALEELQLYTDYGLQKKDEIQTSPCTTASPFAPHKNICFLKSEAEDAH